MGENGRNCECIEKDKLEKEQLGKKKFFKIILTYLEIIAV